MSESAFAARRFLITGGSGFLGINMIRYLLERGHSVRSLDLLPFDYADCKDRVDAIVGDIRYSATADRVCADIDIVIHAAAALPSYSPEDIRTTDVDGTRRMLEAAEKHGIERFIMISSTAVYGIPDYNPQHEDDPLVGVGPYGEAKIAAEEVCLEYRRKGMCVPIVRPKTFIGPERLGVFALLYDWANTGHGFPMVGRGNNRYQLLDVEDLCDAIYLCCTLERSVVDDTFNIGASQFTTMKQDYQVVLDRAGFGKHIHGFPAAPMIWALRVLEKVHLSPLYNWVYETAAKDSFVSIEKAQRELGFAPRFSNQDALLRNFEWYREHLDEFQDVGGLSHRSPWKQGALSVAKRFF